MKSTRSLAGSAAVVTLLTIGASRSLAEIPRPEHPRPDMFRESWMTLNGEWQFEIDKDADGEARGLTYGRDLNARIIVPFCPESRLSGLGLPTTEHMKDVWYRRTFHVPAAMKGKRVRIHFGGVDYRAWVYINGQLAGSHIGESAGFWFEITRFLKDGANEVVVKVLDDLWSGLQPGGKQSGNDQSAGCFYTRTTGIWQPVWLEAVGPSFVENLSVVPDPDGSRVLIAARINGPDKDLKLTAEAFADGRPAGSDTTTGPWQSTLVLNLTEKKLWEPGAPFLYDLKLTLRSGEEAVDELRSYFSSPPEGPFPPTRYFNPASSRADRGVPFMISEIGGIGWATEGGWSYGSGPKTLDEFYSRYKGTIDAMLDNPNLFGFCYTQLTDIEQERNGLYFYDRRPKFDAGKLSEITARQAAYERGEPMAAPPAVKMLDAKWSVLVGAVQDGKLSTPYKYVTETPAGDWMKEGYDDGAWKTGLAPFGNGGGTRTEWRTPEIYFRKTFGYAGGDLKYGAVVIRHNDNTEIHINGQKILGVTGSRGYHMVILTEKLKTVLRKGVNTIAVHSHEGGSGQWIDLAILVD